MSYKTMAERAADETAHRRAIRALDILSNAQLLQEAVTDFADPDQFVAAACVAFATTDTGPMKDMAYRAAQAMAAHDVKELTEDDIQREDDDARAERSHDE